MGNETMFPQKGVITATAYPGSQYRAGRNGEAIPPDDINKSCQADWVEMLKGRIDR